MNNLADFKDNKDETHSLRDQFQKKRVHNYWDARWDGDIEASARIGARKAAVVLPQTRRLDQDTSVIMNTRDAIWSAVKDVISALPEPAQSYYWADRNRLAHDADLAISPGSSFLDVGSGLSPLAAILSVLGMKTTMLDRFDYPVDQRHAMNREAIGRVFDRYGVTRIQADIESGGIPLADDSVVVACCLAVIEHLHHNPLRLLREIYRVLKPGGRVIISAPNAVNLRKRVSVLLGDTNLPSMRSFCEGDKWYGHVHEPTRNELKWLMQKADFADIRVFGRNFIAAQNYGAVGKALSNLLPTGMRSELYAVASVQQRSGPT